MIDLHCHILPGVDDGAASEEESCMMAQMAADNGVTAIVATPHCNIPGWEDNYMSNDLRDRFLGMARLLKEQKIPIRLYTGAEVFVTPEVPRLIREKKFLTLAGSRYLLVEFAFDESIVFAERMLDAIQREGLIPVVAHPERYYFVQEDPGCLHRWTRKGVVLQLNKGSLLGAFGRHARRVACWCLEEGCVHLIGSDAHSPYRRTPRLSDAWDFVSGYTIPEIADFLLKENPERILQDRPVGPVLAEF